MKNEEKVIKRNALRYNEYYNSQNIFDRLYQESKDNSKFVNLMRLINSENNIMLAYRNIKSNKGSKTAGVDGKTIDDYKIINEDTFIKHIQNRLLNFRPQEVKRIEIPKANGKMRPLGIPTIEDRIIQQCIKQVLEPICEAKFYKNSYGFRPNRSVEHAVASMVKKVNIDKCYFVVDVDIEGFFDNINHNKLIKQMWTLGIRDKNLLCIIKKMLKAPIRGIGIPTKGTPQGGILSPLLSNIVLNELDWRIADQWENFPYKREIKMQLNKQGSENTGNRYASMRKYTKLKEMHIIRYADDFKIFCKNYDDAKRTFFAVEKWLKIRLDLNINKEKSKITNVKISPTEFLGFKFKAFKKSNKYIIQSHMTEKAKKNALEKIKTATVKMGKNPTIKNVNNYNATILGIQNYYQIATLINHDLSQIAFKNSVKLKHVIRRVGSDKGYINEIYRKRYKNNFKKNFINKIILYPLADIQTKNPMNLNKKVNPYTSEGRETIHKNLINEDINVIKYLLNNPIINKSVEYNDNRLSVYSAQKGMCLISGEKLKIGNMELHHITPIYLNGKDEFKNLIYVTTEMHDLIHGANDINNMKPRLREILKNINKKTLKKLNKYRVLCGNNIYNEKDINDGKPYEVKISRTVWDGGKAGDSIKGLPIVIIVKERIKND